MIGAQILTQAMAESGTSVVFSLSGNQIMPLYDACLEPGIRIVHVRHESAAVFMADAYAQLSDPQGQAAQEQAAQAQSAQEHGLPADSGVGVALVTAGPGFANALGGLYSALMAESPVVLISGDSAVSQDGSRAFQELAQTTAAQPFVKHTVRVTDVAELAKAWFECISIATAGTPGPVHLAVPFDVLLAEGDSAECVDTRVTEQRDLSANHVVDIIAALHAADKPLVLTGPAMTASRMPDRFAHLQSVLGIPVIAMESPRGLADPSLGKVKAIVQQADCVLLLGKLPDFTLGFGAESTLPAKLIIVVDASAQSLQQSVRVLGERGVTNVKDGEQSSGLQGVKAINEKPVVVADAICRNYQSITEHAEWLTFSVAQLAASPRLPDVVTGFTDAAKPVSSASVGSAHNPELTPQQIGIEVQRAVDQCEQSVLVCDGGEFGQWAQACVRSDRRIINGPSGAIGGSLPQAVAAKIADPHSVVFAMLGDGTAGFHLAELETSVREQAPIIVIIGNDSRWNAEYQIQLRDYGEDRLHSCELGTDIRYDQAAVGLGCAGVLVQTTTELERALAEAVSRSQHERQTTCINVSMAGWPAPVY